MSAVPSGRTIAFEHRTRLGADAQSGWDSVTTPAGINAEFQPWMRMTVPRRLRAMRLDEVELGVRICRSWVLLLGVVPFEYDDIVLVERGPGLRFLERSSTLAANTWQHERTVEPRGSGCEVIDRLRLELRPSLARVPGSAALVRRVVRAIFDHRHRRLTGRFGSSAAQVPLRTAPDRDD
jgi:ligand-binding SRPBCC domain-containing protein